MAAVYTSNIVIDSGSDFYQTFSLEDTNTNDSLNLSGYSIYSQLRKWSGSSNAVSFASTVVSSSQGTVSIGLSASASVSLKPGRYVYDILIQDPTGKKTRVIEGMVLVREGVTKI